MGMGVFVRRKWAASGAGTLAVGNFAILEVVYGFSEESFNSAKFYVGYFPANLNLNNYPLPWESQSRLAAPVHLHICSTTAPM